MVQVTRGIKKSGIYIIYIGSRRAISNDIATSTSVIFRPRQKIPSGKAVPSGIFLPRTKNNLGFGAISLYIALQDPIYTLYIHPIY